ncbi:hypothetical protein FRC06_006085, partial [Ceratobasidium sp. 370]
SQEVAAEKPMPTLTHNDQHLNQVSDSANVNPPPSPCTNEMLPPLLLAPNPAQVAGQEIAGDASLPKCKKQTQANSTTQGTAAGAEPPKEPKKCGRPPSLKNKKKAA